jgi:calcium-dependent protein kinase
VIEVEEFKKFYYQNSEHYDSSEIEELAAILDKNRSGNIDFNEFITAMYSRRKLFQIESLEIAFDFLDGDGSGGVSKAELEEILKGVQHEEIEYLFKELDKNEDNYISKSEFLDYFRRYQ